MLEIIKNNMIPLIISIIVSVSTFLITEWLKRRCNLKIYVIDYQEKYYYYDTQNRCDVTEESFTKKTSKVQITATIDICNNTSLPKIIRNVKLKIGDNDRIIVKDKDTENFSHASYHIEQLNNLNISPYTVVRKTITVGLNRDNYTKSDKYYIVYRNNNNSLKKIKFNRLVNTIND